MPVKHFKSMEALRKYEAYKHIHGLAKKHDQSFVFVAGKKHKIKHKEG